MAQSKTTKVYNTFVKGLITEAEALTYPENSSFDELNCLLFRKGNRRRRYGIDYEPDYSLSTPTFDDSLIGTSYAVSAGYWSNVDGDGGTNFIVIQIGPTLYFYDASSSPLSDGLQAFTVDLATYQSQANPGAVRVKMDSGKGFLYVTSERVNPFFVEYDSTGPSITVTQIDFEVRDFEGVDDSLDLDEQPVSLSDLHKYNLFNQGWRNPDKTGTDTKLIDDYFTAISRYPSNTQVWHTAQDSTLTFQPTWLNKTNFGLTPAAKGHYILNPFNKDRSTVSGIAGLTTVSTTKRPTAVAFFAGRVFWGGEKGRIYFSQLLNESGDNVGKCYQLADPTSSQDSALVDTDGGVIPIPAAGEFVKFDVVGTDLIIWADNGIWSITGVEGFKATNYAVNQISTVRASNAETILNVEGTPIFWADTGIYTLAYNDVAANYVAQDLTQDTILSFYNDISQQAKRNAFGAYDPNEKKLYWFYKTDTEDGENSFNFDGVLLFDLSLGAFYPWKISRLTNNSPYVAAAVQSSGISTTLRTENVTDGGEIVTDGGTPVTTEISLQESQPTRLSFLSLVPNSTSSKWTFSRFNNRSFKDWETANGTGASYSSYLITGYELGGDIMRHKQTPYVMCYFKRTETGFTGSETTGYEFDFPSSCKLQVRWEWTDSVVSGRWSSEQQVYRIKRLYTPDTSDLSFDNGFPVVVTKNKVRGKGRAIQFKFSSEEGKDFNLLGWAVSLSGETEV